MDKKEEYNELLKKLYLQLYNNWDYTYYSKWNELFIKIYDKEIKIWIKWLKEIFYPKINENLITKNYFIIFEDIMYEFVFLYIPETPEWYLINEIRKQYLDNEKTIDTYFDSKIEKIKNLIK
jgi:hypothetical protein